MADLLQRIKEAASIGEDSDWEFKSAQGGLPGTLWETYSAFANSRLQELLALHPADISRLLRKLCQRGNLVSDNRRCWAFYQLTGDSTHKESSSHHNEPNSHHNATELQHLTEVAKPIASSQRSSPEKIRRAILELCRGRFLSAPEIAAFLKRYGKSLHQRHIGPMVKAGLLRPKYPLSSNNPKQAYTTEEEEAL